MANDTLTQNTTSVPWGPQGSGLDYGWGKGRGVFDSQFGQPYDPYSLTSRAALAGTRAIAAGPNPLIDPSVNAVSGIAGGANGIDPAMFGSIYSGAQGPGQLNTGMFGDIATGEMVGDGNPYRAAALQDVLDRTSAGVKASMSGAGRYGSDYMGDAMTRALGGVANDFNLAAYNSDMDRMMQAAQAASSEDLARRGIQLSAASGQAGVQDKNITNRLSAAGMAPAMSDFRYADVSKMAGAGAAEDAMSEAVRNQDWDTLSKYLSMFGTIPGSAGTSTSTSTQPGQSSWLNLLGGAGVGAGIGSMFAPGIGTAIGAGIGGLGSLLFG